MSKITAICLKRCQKYCKYLKTLLFIRINWRDGMVESIIPLRIVEYQSHNTIHCMDKSLTAGKVFK